MPKVTCKYLNYQIRLAALIAGLFVFNAESASAEDTTIFDANNTRAAPDRWLTATVRYEGGPLALRVRPEIATSITEKRFPQLVAITLQLAHVRPDGLPEADYNDSLSDLDHDLVSLFDQSGVGVPVLVETLGGRRTFYSYTQTDAPVRELVSILQRKYPGHAVSFQVKSDPHWSLFVEYRKRYPW